MDKKVYRPLWSYDVKKTERWLTSMSEKGFHLVELRRKSRCFIFKQGKAQSVLYRITYGKIQGHSLPSALKEDGWRKAASSKHWHFLVNAQNQGDIKSEPVREGIVDRNRKNFYFYNSILIFFAFIIFFNLSLLIPSYLYGGSVHVEESPYWIITYTALVFLISLLIFSVYAVRKINKTNQELIDDDHIVLEGKKASLNVDQHHLSQSGERIVKRKFGWMYAPDKLEQWLEQMEEQGYNLSRVGWLGTTFHFYKGSPRKVSYCLEYQNIAKENVMDFHKETGWEKIFSTNSSLQKWTIWAKEYNEGEEKPILYSDKETQLRHAKRVAITYSGMFTPLIIIYLYIIVSNLNYPGLTNLRTSSFILVILSALLILQFGSFSLRSWLYFLRLKKS